MNPFSRKFDWMFLMSHKDSRAGLLQEMNQKMAHRIIGIRDLVEEKEYVGVCTEFVPRNNNSVKCLGYFIDMYSMENEFVTPQEEIIINNKRRTMFGCPRLKHSVFYDIHNPDNMYTSPVFFKKIHLSYGISSVGWAEGSHVFLKGSKNFGITEPWSSINCVYANNNENKIKIVCISLLFGKVARKKSYEERQDVYDHALNIMKNNERIRYMDILGPDLGFQISKSPDGVHVMFFATNKKIIKSVTIFRGKDGSMVRKTSGTNNASQLLGDIYKEFVMLEKRARTLV